MAALQEARNAGNSSPSASNANERDSKDKEGGKEGENKGLKKRGKRLRNELADSVGFASADFRSVVEKGTGACDAGAAARALGLSMLQQSEVRGVTRRASRVAGEAVVAAELKMSGGAAAAAASGQSDGPGSSSEGSPGNTNEGGGFSKPSPARPGATGIMSTSPGGVLDVGALASSMLQRLVDEKEHVEVPIGPMHQAEIPDYEGPCPSAVCTAAAEAAAAAEVAAKERDRLRLLRGCSRGSAVVA